LVAAAPGFFRGLFVAGGFSADRAVLALFAEPLAAPLDRDAVALVPRATRPAGAARAKKKSFSF